MTPLSPLEGLSEVLWSVEATAGGTPIGAASAVVEEAALTLAVTLKDLGSAGQLLGFSALEQVAIKRPGQALLAAVREGGLLLAAVDAGRGTVRVQQALERWRGEPPAPTPPSPAQLKGAPRIPPAPASPPRDAVFAGTLSEFSVPDLLEFLRGAQRSGVLVLNSGAKAGVVRFRDGWIIGINTLTTPIMTLAAFGEVTPDQVEALVRGCGVTTEIVLHQQVLVALRQLVTWTVGEFAFTREPHPEQALEALALVDCRRALFEVFRELDEAAGATPSELTN